ncbi:MAG: toxic anion resistance protein [Tissierellia bacterium]|nr:toxic anion resistance protein [Tissierellia bacterium]
MPEKKDLSLEDLMKGYSQVSPDLDPGTLEDLALLDPEERIQVEKIKEAIDLRDSQALALYGAQTQKGVAQFSSQILSEVRAKDAGDVGALMTDLMVRVKDLDFSSLEGDSLLSRLPLVKKTKRSIEKFIARYDLVESQIDKISAQLEGARMELLKDIGVFDKLYEKNVDYFHQLQYYIMAGEEKIQEVREETLPGLYQEASQAQDPMALQVVKDFEDSLNRFEKKIFDLKTSKTLAIQTAPQIKLIQNNDKLLVDKVTDAINNTIPLWKAQMVLALGSHKQAQVLSMQKQVSDTTKDLLEKNAQKLKQTTLEVAQEAQRSTIDVDTLKRVNDDLISTIEESLKIHHQAKENRAKAELDLREIEEKLMASLKEAARPRP